MDEPFIGAKEAGEIVGLSPAALAQMRYSGEGPRYYRPTPRTVLYRRSDMFAWVEASAQVSNDEVAYA